MKIILIALCLFSFGCGFKLNSVYVAEYKKIIGEALRAKKEHPEQNVFDGEVEPALPNEEENFKTILGIDANHNGIRDDIDIWINRTGVDYNERMAMRQFARATQERLRVCSKKLTNEASMVVSNSMTAHECLWSINNPRGAEVFEIEDKILILTYNDSERSDCRLFYDSAPISASAKMKDQSYCLFDIKNKNLLIKESRQKQELIK